MSAGESKVEDVARTHVDLEKSADILQTTFEHYYGIAMDHHSLASTSSNLMLVVIGAIAAFIGLDNKVCGLVDFGGAVILTVIGLFGGVWALKQHERYHYWRQMALEYQRELSKIVRQLQTEDKYEKKAQAAAHKETGSILARRVYVRHLWIVLYIFIVLMGLGLSYALLTGLTCS